MNLRHRTAVLLAILFSCLVARSQTTQGLPSSLYANFMGDWTGTDHYQKDGVWIDVAVDLKITQDKGRMRFDYTYGTKGKKDYDRSTRFVTLVPDKSEVILQWKRQSKEKWAATGLKEFANTGYGTFFVGNDVYTNGHMVRYRGTLVLDKDSFTYQWETSPDGQNFNLSAIWKLTRASQSVVSSSQ